MTICIPIFFLSSFLSFVVDWLFKNIDIENVRKIRRISLCLELTLTLKFIAVGNISTYARLSIFSYIFLSFLFLFFSYPRNNNKKKGISTLSSCGNPEALPELPPGDEHRLQRAALNLQQKLILREWLKENRLQSYYSR